MLRLKYLRVENNITQSKLASKLRLSQQTISGYENGTRIPDQTTLEILANFFDVTIDYLTGRTDNPNTLMFGNNSLPKKLKQDSVDYLEISKYVKDYGLSRNEIKEILELALEIRTK